MHRILLLGILALPAMAVAQVPPGTRPPANAPHAFTDAPVPGVDAQRVSPANRAGGALDAGPFNSTPFSSSSSAVLTGDQPARALGESRPDRSPTAATVDPQH